MWMGWFNEMKGTALQPEKLFTWDLEAQGLDFATLRDAVDHMYSQAYIAPYEGAVEVLSRLHRLTEEPLLFITGRRLPSTAEKQLQALPWNGTVPEMVVIGGNRDKRQYLSDVRVDFMVEDDPEYLKDYLEMGVGVGLMLRPWNKALAAPATRRFDGWIDLEKWFIATNGHGSRTSGPDSNIDRRR
jgi:hypothetical protein